MILEIIIIGLVVVIFLLITNVLAKLESLSTRVKRLEYTLGQVAQQVEVPEHPVNDELRKLKQEGKQVEAVKKAREVLGLSLLEAKQYVDGL